MRRILRVALLLGIAMGPGGAAIVVTAGTGCGAGNGTSATCSAGVVTGGNLIIVGVAASGGSGSVTVADQVDGAYTQIGTDAAQGSAFTALWYKVASSSGTSRTVTVSAVSGSKYYAVMPNVISGQATSGFIDEIKTAVSASAASITCATFTRTGNEAIIGAGVTNASGNPVGWTNAGSTGTFTFGAKNENGNCCQAGASAYQVITSGTSYSWVIGDTAGTTAMTCSAVSIKEAAAGGATPAKRRVTQDGH